MLEPPEPPLNKGGAVGRNAMIKTSDHVIAIDELRKSYRRGLWRGSVDALRGVSFRVGPGEIFGLLGPNGAGKTTIIKILLGIVRASGGSAQLLGFPAGDRRGRRQVGYLPENLQFPRHQTAHGTRVLRSAQRDVVLADPRRRDSLLSTVGLKDRDRESVKRYSKGMQQRLGLAQALLHDPAVLILDEPTDGLDPVGRSQVRSILVQLRNEGRTVFLNSHLLQEVELVCDRVAILDFGQLRFEGTISDLTPTHETALTLDLVGGDAALQTVLASRTVEQLRAVSAGRYHAVVPLKNQEEADRFVDDLRRTGVSILSMAWRRKTLEDAFLELVTKESH